MLRPLPGQWFRKRFVRGTNSDVDPNELPDGVYPNSFNMRNTSIDGYAGSLKQIGGEVLVEEVNVPGADTYYCIASVSISGHRVNFWANSDTNFPPLIDIDGVLSAMSQDIPYVFDRKLKYALIEGCKKGFILPVDGQAPSLFWDVQDLIDNQGTPKYFSGFNIGLQYMGLFSSPCIPVYNEIQPLRDLGGPVGLTVGMVSYSVRFKTANGNATAWGPESGMIDIPAHWAPNSYSPLNNPQSQIYPGWGTIGGFANPLVPTPYAPNMLFRVDNQFGYAYAEIKRRRYNSSDGLLDSGIEEIIARIPISPGQLNIVPFCDPVDANINPPEVVSANQSTNQQVVINRAGAVEYANGRVVYADYELLSEPSLTFVEDAGRKATSITKELSKMSNGVRVPDGYDNPFNIAYNKSARRGELYGYGVQAWNNGFGLFYAVDIPGLESYQHPNRLDIKGENGDYGEKSLTFSDNPIYRANINCQNLISAEGPVGATFEVYTQGTMAKTDCTSLVNISLPTSDQPPVGRDYNQFFLFSSQLPPPGVVNSNGGWVYPNPSGGYQPWRPFNNQSSNSGHNIPPNTAKLVGPACDAGTDPSSGNFLPEQYANTPDNAKARIHAPTYHALGLLLYGINDVSPDISVISIVRTKPAGRVVAQGLFSYALQSNDETVNLGIAGKATNTGWAYFPDAENGIVDAAFWEELQQNPDVGAVQFVSPTGFQTEVYHYSARTFPAGGAFPPMATNGAIAAGLIDMLSYARLQHDEGQVNVGEPPAGGMGYQPIVGSPAPNGNWVGYAKWRTDQAPVGSPESSPNFSFWHQSPDQGNALFDLTLLQQQQQNRSSIYALRTAQYVYGPPTFQTNGQTAFNHPDVRLFHAPWYVTNIIRRNATVPQSNSTPYVPTAVHIPRQVCIGAYAGGQQDFRILTNAERWEDCVNFLGDEYRYTYLQTPANGEQRFLCITGNTVINLSTILNDIATNGFWVAPDGEPVYGVYEQVIDADGIRYLRFGNPAYNTIPILNSRILVRSHFRDIRVFGHDNVIGPQVHAVMDNKATEEDFPNYNSFFLGGLPLPHAGVMMNPRVFMPDTGGSTEARIWANYMMTIRQWVIAWDVESTNPSSLYVNVNSTPGVRQDEQQFFPAMHYVERPTRFNGPLSYNGIFPQYAGDYPEEVVIFGLGGIRFRPACNYSYAKQWDVGFFGLPKAGYVPNTDRCNYMIASDVFSTTQQDKPNLRTFEQQNEHAISDDTGRIQVIKSGTGGGIGQVMNWVTERGYGYTLTNKHVLAGADGSFVTTQAVDNYWGEDVFLSRSVGMPDQFHRTFLMASAPAGPGTDQLVDTMFWANREDVYKWQVGGRSVPIGIDNWLRELLPQIGTIGSGLAENITAAYDKRHHEYLLSIVKVSNDRYAQHQPFVYSARRAMWNGSYGHRFDILQYHQGKMYGMRNLKTFELDVASSTQQNGAEITSFGEAVYSPKPGIKFQAQAFRTHKSKPHRIELYDINHNLIWFTDQVTQETLSPGTGGDYVLNIDGWEHLVGRTNLDLGLGDLPQQELFYLRFIFFDQVQPIISDAQLQLHEIV